MGAIIDFFKSLIDFFALLFDVVLQIITGLVDFAVSLVKAPVLVAEAFSMIPLPAVVMTGIAGIIAIVIILRVIGRD